MTNQAPALSQYDQLLAVLNRIALALESAHGDDETIGVPLGDFATFDWATIDAKVIARDEFGVSAVWHDGKIYKRRSNDKFGEDIWFARGAGKNDDGTPKYRRLIEFRPFKPAEPLGRKTESALKAAQPTQQGTTSVPLVPPPLPGSPLSTLTADQISAHTALLEEAKRAGLNVPGHMYLMSDMTVAAADQAIKAVRRLIDVNKSKPVEHTPAWQASYTDLVKELGWAATFAARGVVVPEHLKFAETDDEDKLAMKLSTLRQYLAADRKRIADEDAAKIAAGKPKSAARPLAPATLRDMLATKSDQKGHLTASAAQRGLVAMLMESTLGSEPKRHTVLRYLWGKPSIKDVTDVQILATLDWLKPAQQADGSYNVDHYARQEMEAIVTQALQDAGQQSFA